MADSAATESSYLQMVRNARNRGQSFLHDPNLHLSPRQREAMRNNLVALENLEREETGR